MNAPSHDPPCRGENDGLAAQHVVADRTGHRFALRWIDCPTCGPARTKVLGLRGGARHRYGLGITSSIVRCERCSLLFPNPFPFPVNPQSLYDDPESYFARHPEDARIAEYRHLVREVIRRSKLSKPSLLDVGSGRGDLLHAAYAEGLTDIVGVEFSSAMVEFARNRHRIEVVHKTLEEFVSEESRTFDAVVLNAVIEHVYDPNALIQNVSDVLSPGGVLYIDTPRDPNLLTWLGNAHNSLMRRHEVFNLSPTWPPFHLFGFTPRSVQALLTKHGFSVESIRVRGETHLPAEGRTHDALRAFVGKQILRLGNITRTGSNMFVWARREL